MADVDALIGHGKALRAFIIAIVLNRRRAQTVGVVGAASLGIELVAFDRRDETRTVQPAIDRSAIIHRRRVA